MRVAKLSSVPLKEGDRVQLSWNAGGDPTAVLEYVEISLPLSKQLLCLFHRHTWQLSDPPLLLIGMYSENREQALMVLASDNGLPAFQTRVQTANVHEQGKVMLCSSQWLSWSSLTRSVSSHLWQAFF